MRASWHASVLRRATSNRRVGCGGVFRVVGQKLADAQLNKLFITFVASFVARKTFYGIDNINNIDHEDWI